MANTSRKVFGHAAHLFCALVLLVNVYAKLLSDHPGNVLKTDRLTILAQATRSQSFLERFNRDGAALFDFRACAKAHGR